MGYRTPGHKLVDGGLAEGFRSGLEEKVADQLRGLGVEVKFEQLKVSYVVPERGAKYTPDFELPNGIIIETKGRFLTKDRQKHILIKKQKPDLDIRFVFSSSRTRISKTSTTTYADWCRKHGFQFADGLIPLDWINEATGK